MARARGGVGAHPVARVAPRKTSWAAPLRRTTATRPAAPRWSHHRRATPRADPEHVAARLGPKASRAGAGPTARAVPESPDCGTARDALRGSIGTRSCPHGAEGDRGTATVQLPLQSGGCWCVAWGYQRYFMFLADGPGDTWPCCPILRLPPGRRYTHLEIWSHDHPIHSGKWDG